MESDHFNYFRVKNFKRFKDLEVKDIGHFNLVLGDNNVGKTSLLEALLIPSELTERTVSKFVGHLYKALDFRNSSKEKANFWRYFLPAEIFYIKSSNPIEFTFKLGNKEQLRVSLTADQRFKHSDRFLISGEENYIGIDQTDVDHFRNNSDVALIPFQGSFSEEIAEFYLQYMQGNKSLKKRFIRALSELFNDIEDLELSLLDNNEKTLLVNRTDFNYSIPLAFYGEGTIKLTKILSHVIKNSGDHIMIDELDAGMHYSRMKDFWRILIETSKENKTQIFATTHNQECIKAYYEALEELGVEFQEKARVISLVEHQKTKEVSSVTFDFEEFQHSLLAGNEIR